MATTIHAFVKEDQDVSINSQGIIKISMVVKLWRIVDGEVTNENQDTVDVEFDSNAAISFINDAITDALVDFAQDTYSWTLPRTKCVFRQFVRGLII